MSLLEQLGLGVGLGAMFGGYPQQQYPPAYYPQYNPICIHSSCPICLEQAKQYQEVSMKHQELLKEQEEAKTKKKEDYKKRCMEYMDKFRNKI